ncbi:MAG: LacI family DNA-binding transcriptional regulator [Verrucomicrobia bacterium]|nr:LacI family DNA-binding transcriptional regulator [Verrucomicrobiota bacterium]
MPPTIRDVAKEAKVSTGTVSRVINDDPTVRNETRDQVLKAIAAIGYKRLRAPRRAVEHTSLHGKTIAMVLLGIDRALASQPHVAESIHGVERAIAAAGGRMLLADIPLANEFPAHLSTERLDGAIIKAALIDKDISTAHTPSLDRLRRLPCVWLHGRPRGAWGDGVGSHDILVGEMAAAALVEQGHKRLAALNPLPDDLVMMRRVMAMASRATALGATVSVATSPSTGKWKFPVSAAISPASVAQLMDELRRVKPRPTALFVPADAIAAQVYHLLAAAGVVVGKDLSVISCNHEQAITASLHPTLCTLDIQAGVIGTYAVSQLTWRLGHPQAAAVDVGIEPILLMGASLGPRGSS